MQCNVSLPPPPSPCHPPPLASLLSPYLAALVVISLEVQKPPYPLLRSFENLSALLGNVITINGVPFNPNRIGISCLDALLKLPNFPEMPEDALRLLTVVHKIWKEQIHQKHRAQVVLKHMLIQTELWEEELKKANADYTQVIMSLGMIHAVIHRRGLSIIMLPESESSTKSITKLDEGEESS
ncbi:hypothetical protein EW146_g3838 [Bondarzewia mesenterica]|uniref:Uncharacterized protein n=1 Tax=Bondarzewia mesenterica TaxID=1095465 RepID=A0A4S4LWU7_9AGAM|nr:hypothetical protein EW146_g3838 [Bondarzewia mesenterica]